MGRANITVAAGSLFMFLAVLLGAFGAHALKARLAPEMLTVYQTGVQYHLVHALGLLLIGTMQDHANKHHASRLLKLAAIFIAVGIVLFSGSLYILAITGVKGVGAITPVGGLCFLVGWALVAWQMLRRG
jgi:uncharacterized membrane protein YgdD (TMEM256/DUF423 family)